MASAFPMLSPPALPPAENLDLTREGSPLQVPRSRSLTALPLRSPPLGPGRRAAFEYPARRAQRARGRPPGDLGRPAVSRGARPPRARLALGARSPPSSWERMAFEYHRSAWVRSARRAAAIQGGGASAP